MTGTETLCCPICQGLLKHYDRRIRKAIGSEEVKQYSLRRLRCQTCGKLHLELPDFLLPYKRYEAKVIVAVIHGEAAQAPNETRTIQKIRSWYKQIISALTGIWHRVVSSGFASPKKEPDLYLLVRAAVNSGFWPIHPYGHYPGSKNPL